MTDYLPVKPYLQWDSFEGMAKLVDKFGALTLGLFSLLGCVAPCTDLTQSVRLYANSYQVFMCLRDTPWTSC